MKIIDRDKWHYKQYSRDPEPAKLEFQARSKKIGLWSEPDPVAPWEWRKKLKGTHKLRVVD